MQSYCINMEIHIIVNLFDITFEYKDLLRFVNMWRSDLCNFSDAYIVAEGDITVTETNNAKRNKSVAFRANAPFINCVSKINGVQIDYADY